MTVQSSTIQIDHDGSQMAAYVARPDPGSGPHPAVIVLQEIFGVNAEVKRIADLVASAGYVALAPNYYHRTDPELNEPYTPEGYERGFKVAAQVTRETLRKDVSASIAWLNQQKFVKPGKVATWGFCFGGSAAFVTATVPGLAGAVCFYGTSIVSAFPSGEPEGLSDAKYISIPLLLAFGGQDDSIPQAQRERLRKTLDETGADYQIQVYPSVGHAFFRGSSANMQSDVVSDAWDLVRAFFKKVFI